MGFVLDTIPAMCCHLRAWRDARHPVVDPFLERLEGPTSAVHLAVLRQPYLSMILDGSKTIESRWSQNRILPFNGVLPGDVVILKESSGLVHGVMIAGDVEFFSKSFEESWPPAVTRSLPQIGISEAPSGTRYCTLIHVGKFLRVSPLAIDKKSRQSWVVLRTRGRAAWKGSVQKTRSAVHHLKEPERFEASEGWREDQPGWYYWDETWANRNGPYDTREECESAFNRYVEAML